MWAGFIFFVLAMLALDLFVLGGNKAHRVSVKETGSWVARSGHCMVAGWLHVRMGEAAGEVVALGSQGIAIGSHGLTATDPLLLGSVACKVVPLGKVPVLIVR